MNIRIQRREVEIPEDNPFEYDLLDRKEKIDVLTRLVGNIEGPCAMAVDAAWGAGKTTFLKMWAQHLRNEGFPVVEFNAWETDFTGEPFVALSSEITEGLKERNEPDVRTKIQSTRTIAKDVFRWVGPGAIRLAASTIPLAGAEIGKVASALAERLLTEYPEARQSVKEFRSELEKLAAALWESSDHKPLVVFIDELDRCRPSYAIELLETGKHIFSVDHIVFVLAVNRAELAHSVRVLYGERFGAEEYLRRFFDIDFLLPAPDRQKFIGDLIEAVGVGRYLGRTHDRASQNLGQVALEVVRACFSQTESHLSLRTLAQSIHRFGMVLSSLSDDEKGYVRTLAVLTVIATLDPSLYRELASGELTDQEVVQAFFGRHGLEGLRHTPTGTTIEAVIIATKLDWRNFPHPPMDDLSARSPLWHRYEEIVDSNKPTDRATQATWSHAHDVFQAVLQFLDSRYRGNELLGFQQSVERLELLSPDLLGVEGDQ